MEEILIAEHLFPLWKPDLITWVMEYLKPENVRVHVVAKLYENIADESEKWYGVKFKKEKISQNIISKWINAGLNSDLNLPPKNEFIPEKFDIKPAESAVSKFVLYMYYVLYMLYTLYVYNACEKIISLFLDIQISNNY